MLIENVVSLDDSVDDKSRIMNEIDSYLRTKTNLSIENGLKDFPVMRKIFQKYNCIRTSEAICERLFSYCGILYFLIDKKNQCCFVKVCCEYMFVSLFNSMLFDLMLYLKFFGLKA